MRFDRKLSFRGRAPQVPSHNAVALAKSHKHGVPLSKRDRGGRRSQRLPFAPPEDWYEPVENGGSCRIVVQEPGPGYRHVLTPAEVRERLSLLPPEFLAPLEVLQFSRMTRKKRSFPCYGMQWGSSLYLYPIEETLTEQYDRPPKPAQLIEARMYGGAWEQDGNNWKLVWSEANLKDFYLNNILMHELGHLLDERNTTYTDRERYAEWFAVRYGYQAACRSSRRVKQAVVRRHG